MEWSGGCCLIINSPDNTTQAFPIHLLFFVRKDVPKYGVTLNCHLFYGYLVFCYIVCSIFKITHFDVHFYANPAFEHIYKAAVSVLFVFFITNYCSSLA